MVSPSPPLLLLALSILSHELPTDSAAAATTWLPAPSLPGRLMGMQGGVHNDALYVLGGYNGTAIQNSVLRFTVNGSGGRGTWTQLPVTVPALTEDGVPLGSDDSGSAVLGDSLYVIGGITSLGSGGLIKNNKNVSAVGELNLVTLQWAPSPPPMAAARRGLAIAVDAKNNALFAVGGLNCKLDCYGEDVEYLSVVERFDGSSRSWTLMPPMLSPRREPVAAVVGRFLIVMGGCYSSIGSSTQCDALATVEALDLDATPPKWAMWKPMALPLHGFGLGICTAAGTGTTTLVAFGGSQQPGIMNNPTPEATACALSVPSDGDASAATWSCAVPELANARYGLLKGYGLALRSGAGGGEEEIYAVGGSLKKPGSLNPTDLVERLSCVTVHEAVAGNEKANGKKKTKKVKGEKKMEKGEGEDEDKGRLRKRGGVTRASA